MADSTKGRRWTDAELDIMLRALYDLRAGRKVMTSTNIETTTIFEAVSAAMKKEGYERLYSQIRSKFKKEKSVFFEAMEEHKGLPPRDLWGPRFHLLTRLWEQAGRPDYRDRKPAACARPRKGFLKRKTAADDTAVTSGAVQESPITTTADPGLEVPSFVTEERSPSFAELVTVVLNNRNEIARLRRTNEFLRQGLLRLKDGREQARLANALENQAEESSSSEAEDTESDEDSAGDSGQEDLSQEQVVSLDEAGGVPGDDASKEEPKVGSSAYYLELNNGKNK